MKERALICHRHPIGTEGLREIRCSGKYDVLKIIGTDNDVDLSPYSEIVLHYQSHIDVIDSVFLDFVKKNRSQLKDASLLFDVPMEVIEDIGMERSIEYMRSICREVFGEDIPFYIHSNDGMPVQADRFSKLGVKTDENRYWAKSSDHSAILAQYYLDEMHSIPRKTFPLMIIGLLLILAGAILSILSYFSIVVSSSAYSVTIIVGIIAVLTAYYGTIWNHWKKDR